MDRPDRDGEHADRLRPSGSAGGGNVAPMAPAADLLTPGEVARLFGVDPKTVTRWADAGKLPVLRTLGGHRRYPREAIAEILSGVRA